VVHQVLVVPRREPHQVLVAKVLPQAAQRVLAVQKVYVDRPALSYVKICYYPLLIFSKKDALN
jgi:hypothetical protein